MREESAPRFYLVDKFQRAIDPEVCRMLAETKTVKHEHVEILQRVDRFGRYVAEIREIGKIIEPIGHPGEPAVDYFQRRDLEFGTDTERRLRIDCVGNHPRQSAAEVRRFKDVFENALDIDPRAFVCINAKGAETKV